ncbi:MAG: ATP-binding protein [Actinobacteria bacterium]|nr:ATP-binding protein [Actinomycetota bacterium]
MGEVRLGLPAQPGFVQVARLTVAAVASRVGFSYDEIEDLRIAVGEVCGLLVAPHSDARITVRVSTTDARITVDVTREPAGPRVEVGELSEQILEAVADEVEIDATAGHVLVTKQRQG